MRRSARLTWAVALAWVALQLLGLAAGGWDLHPGNVLLWASVDVDTLLRHGALASALVESGEIQRLVTGAGTFAGGALSLLLGLWVFGSSSAAMERRFGSARAGLVLLASGLAGAWVRVHFGPGGLLPQPAAWDVVMGAVGARIPWGLARGGTEGRTAVSSALAFAALSIALVMLQPGGRWSMLYGNGAGFVAGALALVVLGPRRSERPAGPVVKGLGLLALLAVVAATFVQVRQAIADPGAARASRIFATLEATEDAGRRLWNARDPTRVPRSERAAFGERLDQLGTSPDLEGLEGAAELRAYLESMRPLATGELRDPTAVLPRMKAGWARWEPFEKSLRLRHALPPRSVAPWR